MERRRKAPGGDDRRPTLKEWLAKLMAVPLGRCLPEIVLCMLVCCMLTGYIVLRLEQREQYRQDTFEVYLQEHGQQASAAQAEPPQTESEIAAAPEETHVAEEETARPDEEVTEPEETTALERAERVYASPSGKRYHYDAACPGKNGHEITWNEVERRGLTPCKKCAQ